MVSVLDSGAEGPGFTLSGNSLRQTVHTRRASVHRAAKLVAALLRVAGVTAGLAESLPPGLWLASPAGWLPRTGISSGTLRSVIECGLPLPFVLLRILILAWIIGLLLQVSGWFDSIQVLIDRVAQSVVLTGCRGRFNSPYASENCLNHSILVKLLCFSSWLTFVMHLWPRFS